MAENNPTDRRQRPVNRRVFQWLYRWRRGAPLSAPGYQVMRTDQRRYFGHPDLVQFIQRLSNQVHNKGMGTVLIGDMGMPAGGRFNGGHASHQTGLDVDIFLQLPQTRWTSSQLLKPQALDLVASDGKHVVPSLWSPQISQLIKLAAEDSEVTRIFVNPAIKQQLCLDAGSDRQWLRKSPSLVPASRSYARPTALPGGKSGVRGSRRRRRPAMAAERSCRAGSNHLNPGLPPVKKTPPPLPPSCQALLDEHVL